MILCILNGNLKGISAYAQSDQSLCQSLEYSMSDKLLTKHHLEFLSLKGILPFKKHKIIFFQKT